MKLNAYKNFSAFKRKFHEYCVECETEGTKYPMYDGFLKLLFELAANAENEQEKNELTSEYTKAARHWPRAKWVQDKLFTDYGNVLIGPVDLFLWGCGSGLDLLAFYDQALQCDMPHIWTTVRSVTLIDGNADRVHRAVEIAEVLFPLALGRIAGQVCDFESPIDVACLSGTISKQSSHELVPRVHILSESIQSIPHVGAFSRQIKDLLLRKTEKGEVFYNDVFCASDPGGHRKILYGKMCEFKKAWEDETGVGSPESVKQFTDGTYYAFHCMTYRDIRLMVALRSDNPVMRGLFDIMMEEGMGRSWLYMMYALAKLKIHLKNEERYFIDVYRYVKKIELRFDFRKDGKREMARECCLLFAPNDGVEAKAFLLKLGPCATKTERPFEKMDLAKSWLRAFSRFTANEDVLHLAEKLKHIAKGQAVSAEYGKLFGYLRVMAWNAELDRLEEFPGNYSDTFYAKDPADVLMMFGVTANAANAEVLPESLNRAQRGIVFGRKRQRLIRGGPGTGKTLTMLHHALLVYKRTHLPVLFITKTNSLIGNNFRRFQASYFKHFPKSKFMDGGAFVVANVNELLCQLSKGIHVGFGDLSASCKRELCKRCLGAHEGKDGVEASEPNECAECCNKEAAIRAVGLKKNDEFGNPVDRRDEKMEVLSSACNKCNAEIRAAVSKGEVQIPDHDIHLMHEVHLFCIWGAVLVDEAQLIDPEDVKIIHALTEHFNPSREFYIFADEEQTLHKEGTLIRGENGKYSVAVPAKLFGSWKTLKGNHRVKSRILLNVYRQLQEMMSAKYDLSELRMEETDELAEKETSQTVDKVFRIEKSMELPTAEELSELVSRVSDWAKSKTVTIIIDDELSVRDYAAYASSHDWERTHLPHVYDDNDRRIEKNMKKAFFEHADHVHITTIDCAQGRTFENVLFMITRDAVKDNMEEAFTGFTRASRHLYVVDASESHWANGMLSTYGKGNFLSDAILSVAESKVAGPLEEAKGDGAR